MIYDLKRKNAERYLSHIIDGMIEKINFGVHKNIFICDDVIYMRTCENQFIIRIKYCGSSRLMPRSYNICLTDMHRGEFKKLLFRIEEMLHDIIEREKKSSLPPDLGEWVTRFFPYTSSATYTTYGSSSIYSTTLTNGNVSFTI